MRTLLDEYVVVLKRFLLSALAVIFFSFRLGAEVVDIDNPTLEMLLDDDVLLLDIRTKPEWQETGTVKGSIKMTFFDEEGNYDTQYWMGQLRKLVTVDDPIILICRSGRRTKILANYLSEKENFNMVYNVRKGIKGWLADGRSTVTFK